MGYRRMITCTRCDEPGASLRAAGWRRVATRPAAPGWNRPGRPAKPPAPSTTARTLWRVCVADTGRRHTRRVAPSATSAELHRDPRGADDRGGGHAVTRAAVAASDPAEQYQYWQRGPVTL
jgi:hypothetical protein